MLEINYNDFRKRLLKDLYKLKEQIAIEESEEQKIKIMDSILSINAILNEYLLIADRNYNYNDIIKRNSSSLIKLKTSEYNTIRNNINELKKNNNINKKIYNSSKIQIKHFEKSKTLKSLSATHISRKNFYDILFNIPFGNFSDYLDTQLKSKKIYVINLIDIDNSLLDGASFSLPALNYDYNIIETYDEFSYLSIFPIIHEITHSYVERKYNTTTAFNVFREVIPFFHEFKMMDHLNINNMGHTDITINYHEILCSLKANLNNRFKLRRYQDYYNYTYVIGQLLSFHFFEMYKRDPEKCEYYTNYFCNNLDNYAPYDLLQKSNVDIEQLSSGETMKRMIKEYNSYYDKFKS